MENKYYIPEIEELYVGFECEILSSYGYQKGVWPKVLREDTLTGFELAEIKDILRTTNGTSIRVKYLDQEDIESLGWEFVEEKIHYTFKQKDLFLHFYNSTGRIIVDNNKRETLLYICKFSGYIKTNQN